MNHKRSKRTSGFSVMSQLLIGIAIAAAFLGIQIKSNSKIYMMNYIYSSSTSNLQNSQHATTSTSIPNTACQPENKTSLRSPKIYPSMSNLTYYVPARDRRDRSGAAIIDMLKAQAYSYFKGVPFGGACGDTPHRQKTEEMIEVLGLDPILKYDCPPATELTNNADSDIRAPKHEIITRDVFFQDAQKYFTDEWLDYIHTQVQPKSKRWIEELIGNSRNTTEANERDNASDKNQNYTIVVHVRRGDVDPCGHWSFRYLPNSHYTGILDFYSKRAPRDRSVQCIVFSESHSLIENFDEFTKRGCQVILDGDPTLAWKAMLDASVLVMSLSSFSAVPALLNKHGIIAFTPTLSEPLRPSWKWHIYKHSNQGWRYFIALCDEVYKSKLRRL